MRCNTDFFLVQVSLERADSAALLEAGASFCAQSPVPISMHRVAWSVAGQAACLTPSLTAYLYARLVTPTVLEDSVLPALVSSFERVCAGARDVRVSRLEKVFDIEGASRAATPAFHYVVEMDPEAGWMPEIARWYDTEHMPGLAAVPGCVHAMRLINRDHGPWSLACYDLVTAQTLDSPAWLAVRGSAWSDITRPHFTNTQRTMFEVVAPGDCR